MRAVLIKPEEAPEVVEHGVAVIEMTSGDPREPFISGPIVVTGANNVGDTLPIPDMAVQFINALAAQMKEVA